MTKTISEQEAANIERELSVSTNLLISILVRYPEVGTLYFNSEKKLLKFTFIIEDRMEKEGYHAFRKKLLQSLNVFAELEGRSLEYLDVSQVDYENITLVNVVRDIYTLSQRELSLLVNLFGEHFRSALTYDNECGEEIDGMTDQHELSHKQEQMISSMLQKTRNSKQVKNVVGFREDGRVMVYNK